MIKPIGVTTKKKIMPITIGAIIAPSKIPNLNHNRFNGCNKLDFTKPKTKKTKHTIKDQSLMCPSLIKGHKDIIRNTKKKVKPKLRLELI